jgi:adenine-specific DNA-methyltransferase
VDLPTLLGAALQLGAGDVPGWSGAERQLACGLPEHRFDVAELRERINAGDDPLGDAFCAIRSAEERRPLGQTYTPAPIVGSMMGWAEAQGRPERVIDPGAGSGRFLTAAARRWPGAALVGVDVDPVAAIMARANLAAIGASGRSYVAVTDYRTLRADSVEGRTLYVGNPPYVRHHQIAPEWKTWLVKTAGRQGLTASQLAGLHVHFFLATASHGSPADFGTFVTSAEWLDVNYGRLVRELLLGGLGGESVHVLEPTVAAFADAITTAAVSCFHIGSKPRSIRLRRVKQVQELGALAGGRRVSREKLSAASRWGPLVRVTPKLPAGHVELGEFCRVHRGQVTGANSVWITRPGMTELPEQVLFPSVTRARELFNAGGTLADAAPLRLVIDLPEDLDELTADERGAVERFLARAKKAGAADGYIARSRRAWWRVGLRQPAPVLATYMARRPPAFVRNRANARHINIAHGLYPRQPVADHVWDELLRHLRVSVGVGQGRTYAGGLTKFEPREMERLPVPGPEVLLRRAAGVPPRGGTPGSGHAAGS